MGLSLSPKRGHEGRIREVLQEDRCSSMYSNYVHCHPIMSCIHISCCYFLRLGNLIRNINWCYFLRLKINHDSHEFILEPGTGANICLIK
jgi:hypothetical protein